MTRTMQEWLLVPACMTVLAGAVYCQAMHPAPVFGHAYEIVACRGNLVINKAQLISEEALANGLYAERYDTNNDGKFDIVTLSTILSAHREGDEAVVLTHAEHPTFYMVDLDYDDFPDVLYVDKGKGGRCEDIVLYRDFNRPQTPNDQGTMPEDGAGDPRL